MPFFPFTDMPYSWAQKKGREVVPIISFKGGDGHF